MKAARILFDLLFALTLVILVTGGWIFKGNHFYLDLATLDTWPILMLVVFALTRGKVFEGSVLDRVSSRLFAPGAEEFKARIFLTLGFSALFLAHVFKHWSFHTHGFDMAFVHQPLYQPFGPPIFPATISRSGSEFGEHLCFSLFPLALIFQYVRVDELVFLLQAFLIAFPLWKLIEQGPLKDQKQTWFWIALLFFSFHTLRGAEMFDFREDTIAYACLVGMLLALQRGNLLWYVYFLLIGIFSKENVFLITLGFMIPLQFAGSIPLDRRSRRVWTALTLGISLIYAYIGFHYLIPHFNAGAGSTSQITERLPQFGSTPQEVLITVLTSPSAWLFILKNLFTKNALSYLVRILLPAIPFLLFTRARKEAVIWLLPAFAGLAMNVVAAHPGQLSMNFHYDLIVVPFIFMAILVSIRNMDQHRLEKKNVAVYLLIALAVSDKWPGFQITSNLPSHDSIAARIALLKLDRHLPVEVNDRFSAQVTQHPLTIRSAVCDASKKPEPEFHGYVVLDRSVQNEEACVEQASDALFTNSLIQIRKI